MSARDGPVNPLRTPDGRPRDPSPVTAAHGSLKDRIVVYTPLPCHAPRSFVVLYCSTRLPLPVRPFGVFLESSPSSQRPSTFHPRPVLTSYSGRTRDPGPPVPTSSHRTNPARPGPSTGVLVHDSPDSGPFPKVLEDPLCSVTP